MAPEEADDLPKFFADCMLGRLARWLRALGIDTCYEHAIEDDQLLCRCTAENRILLTRDSDLARRRTDVNIVPIESESPREQLAQVMRLFGIEIVPDRLFSRCTHCNSRVEELDREQVQGRVPPFVLENGERFTYCPNCDKIYWGGTHKDRFLDLIGAEEEK
jgi:uncharacterized protein with PIN domain